MNSSSASDGVTKNQFISARCTRKKFTWFLVSNVHNIQHGCSEYSQKLQFDQSRGSIRSVAKFNFSPCQVRFHRSARQIFLRYAVTRRWKRSMSRETRDCNRKCRLIYSISPLLTTKASVCWISSRDATVRWADARCLNKEVRYFSQFK